MLPHEILQKYFRRKEKGTGQSLRALARRLEISPSFLSRILAGKKPVPAKLLARLGAALDIEAEVLTTLSAPAQRVPQARRRVETSLEEWDLAATRTNTVLRHWFYLPILECTTLANYDGRSETIADRLGLSAAIVDAALRELHSLGLVKLESGRYMKSRLKFRWGSAKSLAEVRAFHDQMLSRAQEELRRATSDADFARRLITGITVTANTAKIAGAKERLAECLHAIANELSEGEGTEVYHLSAQLFPLTKK